MYPAPQAEPEGQRVLALGKTYLQVIYLHTYMRTTTSPLYHSAESGAQMPARTRSDTMSYHLHLVLDTKS